jgi:N-methylhydantoinase B
MEHDDVLVMESSGGGGFGDPTERDPARVAADVAEGYVTAAAAETVYGVVLAGGHVDTAATAQRRAQIRDGRARGGGRPGGGLAAGGGRYRRLDAATAARLGVNVGAIVELVNAGGAPLRAWVVEVAPGNGGRAWVAPAALRMLALSGGAEVEIRALHRGALI